MRAQRRLAVLAAAGTIFMAAASVLLAPGVASANPGNDDNRRGRPGYHAPHGNNNGNGNGQGSGYGNGHGNGNGQGSGNGNGNYPAPPASVSVSSGTVSAGKAVRVSGNGFGRNEPVVIQVRYRPATRFWFPRGGIVIGQQTVRTNSNGQFKTYAQTWLPGKVTITARGLKSGKTGSATVNVRVRGWAGGWGGWWGAGESGTPAGTVAVSNNIPAPGRGDGTPLYVLAATVMALVGSALLTQRISRRRRNSTA